MLIHERVQYLCLYIQVCRTSSYTPYTYTPYIYINAVHKDQPDNPPATSFLPMKSLLMAPLASTLGFKNTYGMLILSHLRGAV